MNILQIGYGLIGKKKVDLLKKNFNQEPDIIDLYKKQSNILSALECYPHRKIDFLSISVPHHEILPYIKRISSFEILNLWVDKPLGLTQMEAETIYKIVSTKNIRFCGGYNYRFYPNVMDAKKFIIENGNKLGRFLHGKLVLEHGGRPNMETEWKMKQRYAGGGVIIDPGVHLIDLSSYLLGNLKFIQAKSYNSFWRSDVEDYAFIEFSFQNSPLFIETSTTRWKNIFTIELQFENYLIEISGRGLNYGKMKLSITPRWHWIKEQNTVNHEYEMNDDISFDNELLDFINYGNFHSTLDSSLHVMKHVSNIYRYINH